MISRSNQIPLYIQVLNHLEDEIKSGKWEVGTQLPTQKELADKYNVSLITVRQALTELNQMGYIDNIRGKGTFIKKNKETIGFVQFKSFTEEMELEGRSVSTKVISIFEDNANQVDSDVLKVNEGETILRIKRIRYIDGVESVFTTTTVSMDLGQQLRNFDLNGSLYSVLKAKLNLNIYKASEAIEIDFPNLEAQERLSISEGMPVFKVTRTSFSNNITPIEYTTSVFKGDTTRFFIELFNK
ncbi:GntR family transcriptional regulator [Halobacillus sp. A1]|uniref:GntR family transcriptional regulator n=1 Tax=Halobacillus sp. A1 TaxID=2880262 RepID=UPI0020A66219|nr:GntR family transcriptional regulator [Halobacillus sp. A1]MCP3032589.1 GntR family transcriptional regulator [Halobacillus sp. A1]